MGKIQKPSGAPDFANPMVRLLGRVSSFAVAVAVVLAASRILSEQPNAPVENELNLEQCIQIALQNQLAIHAQRSAVRVAADQVAIARSYYLPQVSFQMRYTALEEPITTDLPNPISGPLADVMTDAAAYFSIARQAGADAAHAALNQPNLPPFSTAKQAAANAIPTMFPVDLIGKNFLTAQLLLVQPLWTGGKIRYRHEEAELGVRAAELDLSKVRQETVFNVTRAYLTIVLTEELQQVAKDTAGRFQAIERLVQNLVNAGNEFVTTADIHRASSLRNLAEGEKAGLTPLRRRAYAALRLAMGLTPQDGFQTADRHLVVGQRDVQLADLVGQALARRPEMAKANLGMRIAELERKLASAEFLPEIGLFGGFTTFQDDRQVPDPNNIQEWSVGVTGQINLFNGGRRIAQRQQAEHRHIQASQVRQLLERVVSQEAEDAYLEYLEASERLRSERQAVEEATKAMDRYDDLLRGGAIADKDMPEYFRDLILTRQVLTGALAKYYQDVYNLNLALGRIRFVTASNEYETFLNRGGPSSSGGDLGSGIPPSTRAE